MDDMWAIAFASGFVLAGLGLSIFAKRRYDIDNSGLFVSLLIVPFAIYLLASGRIAQFEGFGIKARFAELASTEIVQSKVGSISISPERPSWESVEDVETALVQFSGSDSIVLVKTGTTLSTEDRIAKGLLIKNGLLSGSLRFVVIIDEKGRPSGYFHPHTFLDLVHLQFEFSHYEDAGKPDRDGLIRAMKQTKFFWDIMLKPEVRAEDWGEKLFVPINETLLGAFETLSEENARGAIVTDQQGKYRGYVMLSDLSKELLLGFFQAADNSDL